MGGVLPVRDRNCKVWNIHENRTFRKQIHGWKTHKTISRGSPTFFARLIYMFI